MSRVLAVVFAIFLFGLVFVEATTEQSRLQGPLNTQMRVLNVGAQVLFAIGLILYCGFAALHSAQYVTSPRERSVWLIATIGMNVLGSCWYYLTAYQKFRKLGKGRLMPFRKSNDA